MNQRCPPLLSLYAATLHNNKPQRDMERKDAPLKERRHRHHATIKERDAAVGTGTVATPPCNNQY